MAFSRNRWSPQSNSANTGLVTVSGVDFNGPAVFSYGSADDNAATVGGADYFASEAQDLAVGDLIFADCSDAYVSLRVATVTRGASPSVTTETAGFSTGIGTANIQDGAVTLAKLATAVAPSHIVKFAGQPTTVGGAAAEVITVTGAAATDLAFVQMVDDGTNNVTIVNAVVTTNTLTVTFSGDPSSDTVINYQLLRATS